MATRVEGFRLRNHHHHHHHPHHQRHQAPSPRNVPAAAAAAEPEPQPQRWPHRQQRRDRPRPWSSRPQNIPPPPVPDPRQSSSSLLRLWPQRYQRYHRYPPIHLSSTKVILWCSRGRVRPQPQHQSALPSNPHSVGSFQHPVVLQPHACPPCDACAAWDASNCVPACVQTQIVVFALLLQRVHEEHELEQQSVQETDLGSPKPSSPKCSQSELGQEFVVAAGHHAHPRVVCLCGWHVAAHSADGRLAVSRLAISTATDADDACRRPLHGAPSP